jgi:hypothetical protein
MDGVTHGIPDKAASPIPLRSACQPPEAENLKKISWARRPAAAVPAPRRQFLPGINHASSLAADKGSQEFDDL